MNIYCWKYHTPNLELLAVVDDFTSFSFTRSYAGIGTWQLVLDGHTLNANRIQDIDFISFENGAGLVKKQTKSYTNNVAKIQITGVELKGLAARRIVLPPDGSAYLTLKAQPAQLIAQLITQTVAFPIDETRKINSTVINNSTVQQEEIEYSGRFSNLSEDITEIATTYNIGWTADIVDATIVWRIWDGVDRTAAQSANNRLILDHNYGFMDNSSLTTGYNTPSWALVAGQGEELDRAITYIDTGATGLEKYEVYIDARDVEDDSLLPQRGQEKLSQYTDNLNYTLSLSEFGMSGYGEIFNLGDIGSIRDSLYFTGLLDARITAITEVYENNHKKVSITIGYDQDDLKTAIKRNKSILTDEIEFDYVGAKTAIKAITNPEMHTCQTAAGTEYGTYTYTSLGKTISVNLNAVVSLAQYTETEIATGYPIPFNDGWCGVVPAMNGSQVSLKVDSSGTLIAYTPVALDKVQILGGFTYIMY